MRLLIRSGSAHALVALAALLFAVFPSAAQPTVFTYQGRLLDGAVIANGLYDLTFELFDASVDGQSFGSRTNSPTSVSNGLFTVLLDFGGAAFGDGERWLEIGVRTNGGATFQPLSARQRITSVPYAITAANVATGGLASGIYGAQLSFNNAANQFLGAFAGNGVNLTNLTLPFVNVREFGAMGGASDDTTAFQAALDTGKPVFVPATTNYTVGKLALRSGVTLFGPNARLSFKGGVAGTMLDLAGSTNVAVLGLVLDGGAATNATWPATQGNRTGVTAGGCGKTVLRDLFVTGFSDKAFNIFGTNLTSGQAYRTNILELNHCTAAQSYYGFYFGSPGASAVVEYMTMDNLSAYENYYGAFVAAGNQMFSNCRFTGNNYGAYVFSGWNQAHGMFTACSFNHNLNPIYCASFNNSELFNGCEILGGGTITLDSCSGVVIQGGTFSPTTLIAKGASFGGGLNIVRHNLFFGSWPLVIVTNNAKLLVYDNYQSDGTNAARNVVVEPGAKDDVQCQLDDLRAVVIDLSRKLDTLKQ